MKYLPKDVHKLKGKELAELLFPKEALAKIMQEPKAPQKKTARK